MADSIAAIGWAAQAAVGTAVPPTVRSNYVPMNSGKWSRNIQTRIPNYQTGVRIQEASVRRTTLHDTLAIAGADWDFAESLLLLQSCFGPPASNVYKFGTALNSTPTAFLTFKFHMGLSESWQLQDCRVNTLDITGDAANGTLLYDAGILGLLSASQPGGAWSPTTSVPAGDMPIEAWQFSILKGGSSPGCVMNFKISFNNNFNPLYCFPTTAPTITTKPGLAPSRYTDGPPTARFTITMEYTGYTGSSFKDFLDHTVGPWTLTMTDPSGATTPGSLTWALPDLDWISPSDLNHDNPEPRFIGSAVLLLDNTLATSVQATYVPRV